MLRKEAGDEIAKIFKDLMTKNAGGCASHEAVDVEVSKAKDQHNHMKDHAYDMKDQHNHMKDHYSAKDHAYAKDHHYGHAKDHHHAYDADDAVNMMLDNMLEDEEVSAAEDLMGHVKDNMSENFGEDHKKMASLMSGLGKIAGSLRKKGENFAADVVEATAISIDNDFKKTASSNTDNRTLSELKKISEELRSSNNSFAADLVDSTIKKIK